MGAVYLVGVIVTSDSMDHNAISVSVRMNVLSMECATPQPSPDKNFATALKDIME